MSDTEIPPNYRAVAELVAAFVDDKLAEFRTEIVEIVDILSSHAHVLTGLDKRTSTMKATIGGLQDAVAELQVNAGESMPEHVYKQFIRAEAERLRLMKRVVRDGDED